MLSKNCDEKQKWFAFFNAYIVYCQSYASDGQHKRLLSYLTVLQKVESLSARVQTRPKEAELRSTLLKWSTADVRYKCELWVSVSPSQTLNDFCFLFCSLLLLSKHWDIDCIQYNSNPMNLSLMWFTFNWRKVQQTTVY